MINTTPLFANPALSAFLDFFITFLYFPILNFAIIHFKPFHTIILFPWGCKYTTEKDTEIWKHKKMRTDKLIKREDIKIKLNWNLNQNIFWRL